MYDELKDLVIREEAIQLADKARKELIKENGSKQNLYCITCSGTDYNIRANDTSLNVYAEASFRILDCLRDLNRNGVTRAMIQEFIQQSQEDHDDQPEGDLLWPAIEIFAQGNPLDDDRLREAIQLISLGAGVSPESTSHWLFIGPAMKIMVLSVAEENIEQIDDQMYMELAWLMLRLIMMHSSTYILIH